MTKENEEKKTETPLSQSGLKELLDLLAASAYVAWSNTLCGDPSQVQKAYYERMRKPEIGDLVLEVTTFRRASSSDKIGRLLSIEDEPYPDWEDDEPAPTRKVWTIKTLDGRECRWENCDFIVIPEDPFQHQAKI